MPEADIQTILGEAFRHLNELNHRLRVLEERYDLSEARAAGLQEAIIRNTEADRAQEEKFSHELKIIEERLLVISNELARLNKLMEKTAKRSEIEELRQLVELYAPFHKKRES